MTAASPAPRVPAKARKIGRPNDDHHEREEQAERTAMIERVDREIMRVRPRLPADGARHGGRDPAADAAGGEHLHQDHEREDESKAAEGHRAELAGHPGVERVGGDLREHHERGGPGEPRDLPGGADPPGL